jgi:transposase
MERLLGRKTLEVEILKEALGLARAKKPNAALKGQLHHLNCQASTPALTSVASLYSIQKTKYGSQTESGSKNACWLCSWANVQFLCW